MKKEEKCVEYYFDSRKYNKKQIVENMKKEEIGFEKKKSEINIYLNEYGIYVVKLKFLENRIKTRKTYKGYDYYNGDNIVYGKYKETRIYKPIMSYCSIKK